MTIIAALALTLLLGFAGSRQPPDSSGPLLVVLNKSDHEAALVDPSSYEVLARLPTGTGPHEAAVSPDGRFAFATNYGAQTPGNSVTVLDLEERAVARTFDLGDRTRPHGIAVGRDAERLWVTSETTGSVLELDAGSGRVLQVWETGQEGSHMLVPTPDERKLYVANVGSGTVSAIERESGRVITVRTGAGSEGLAVSPDGGELWVGSNGEHTLAVVDVERDSVVAVLPSGGRVPIRVAFTPNGEQVWVSNAETATVTVFDARTRGLLGSIESARCPSGSS
ncbi:MAG: YncE family protein [Gemmatimonadota bacterium]